MKDLSVNITELNNIIIGLNQQYSYLNELYQNIESHLNDLIDSSMQGEAMATIMEVCSDWKEINNNRLLEYQTIINTLKNTYDDYKSLHEEIEKKVA